MEGSFFRSLSFSLSLSLWRVICSILFAINNVNYYNTLNFNEILIEQETDKKSIKRLSPKQKKASEIYKGIRPTPSKFTDNENIFNKVVEACTMTSPQRIIGTRNTIKLNKFKQSKITLKETHNKSLKYSNNKDKYQTYFDKLKRIKELLSVANRKSKMVEIYDNQKLIKRQKSSMNKRNLFSTNIIFNRTQVD